MTKYNIPVTVFKVIGSGNEGRFIVGKAMKNRVCWAKNRTVWRPLKPFMNNKEIQPFPQENIYNGNKIYAFEYNDTWIPGEVNFNIKDGKLKAEIVPIPYYIRNWQSLAHKRNAMEFASGDFWSENKTMITALICVGLCMVMVLGSAYFVYKMTTMAQPSASALTTALNNFASSKLGTVIS